MKRASSARKTRSAAPGAKRPPRRRLVAAKSPSAPAQRKLITKSKPVSRRKPGTKTGPRVRPGTRAKRQPASKSKLVAERNPKPSLQTAAKKKSIVRRTPKKKAPLPRPRVNLPAYLLEGDVPVAPAVTGPGEKFALGPETPVAHFAAETAHLPETYGTGRLHVTPRDPHWLYAHWDIAPRQQFRHNARSVDRHLILRLHEGGARERPVTEIHVHPESRHWFAYVERTETVYVAELGYYQPGRRWKSLATSAPTKTPADHISSDATVEFATIPLELPFETMLGLLKAGTEEKIPLARAIEQLRVSRPASLTPPPAMSAWTAEQDQALGEFFAGDQAARGGPSSLEISELGGPPVAGDLVALPAGEFERSSFFSGADISSPIGGGPSGGNDFWLQVNAELIVYVATQPDANVTIGGKQITLRPDGSFGFRFALPDGQYALPIVAVSADDTDGRAAELKFTRATEFVGAVNAPPQDPALMPPPQNG